MNKLHNKHGTDTDIGKGVTVHSRDGTCRMPRDATTRMPRDWITGLPRDATLMADGSIVNGPFKPEKRLSGIWRIRGKTYFRRRKIVRVNRPYGPVMGEVCPDGS